MTGHVLRWHSNADARLRHSGDATGPHQSRVAALCAEIAAMIGHPLHNSDLIFAAHNHDAAEAVLGDIPGPAKQRFPALAAAYAKAELQVLTEMGLRWNLTAVEDVILKLADRADAWRWAAKHGCGDLPEWQSARGELFRLAHKLGDDAVAWVQGFTETACTQKAAV
jgi:hypothetical protein